MCVITCVCICHIFHLVTPKWFHHVLPLGVSLFIAHLGIYLSLDAKGTLWPNFFNHFFKTTCRIFLHLVTTRWVFQKYYVVNPLITTTKQ
jgi:hypothetical protein